jgi:cell division protein FtsQ
MTRKVRRKKKSAAAKLRPFWFLMGLVACAAGFAGYYAATSPAFYPQTVVIAGNRVVPAREIAARAAIEPRENIWLQNATAAGARVSAIPWIKTATVHRSLPASVRIQVTERKPYANVRYGSGTVLIDPDLRVLSASPGAGTLPVFVAKRSSAPVPGAFVKDATVQALGADYRTLLESHVAVASLQYDKFGDLVAKMRDGVELMLGDDSKISSTAPLIAPILSQVSAGGKKIAAVDLRAPKTPVVVYK